MAHSAKLDRCSPGAMHHSSTRCSGAKLKIRWSRSLHGIGSDQMHVESEIPLVIPCKFSAVFYSERLSGTHSVARRVLPIFLENKDLHSAAVSGSECQRAGTPPASPLVAQFQGAHCTIARATVERFDGVRSPSPRKRSLRTRADLAALLKPVIRALVY